MGCGGGGGGGVGGCPVGFVVCAFLFVLGDAAGNAGCGGGGGGGGGLGVVGGAGGCVVVVFVLLEGRPKPRPCCRSRDEHATLTRRPEG